MRRNGSFHNRRDLWRAHTRNNARRTNGTGPNTHFDGIGTGIDHGLGRFTRR